MSKPKKKSEFDRPDPFMLEVCNAIRHHVGSRVKLEAERKAAFENRDAAVAEINDVRASMIMGDEADRPRAKLEDELLHAQARHSQAITRIDELQKTIRWHASQIDEMVTKADEPGLDVLYEMPEPPPPEKKDDGQLTLDARPVGRPGLKPKPEEPDPSKGDGVDEHLKASVKELDMPERLIGLCEKAGLTKIGHLVKVLDDNDGDAPSLGEAVNGSDKDAKAITKAVKVYRDKHRKAAMKAEGIEA